LNPPRFHLTFDQDWAPDWAVDDLLELLDRQGLTGTFFVTHGSPVLDRLRRSGRVELGLHPNFLPGSSHGSTPAEVMDTLCALVPEAVGARAHYLVQGTPTLQAYAARGLLYDAASLRDDVAGLEPFVSWTGVVDLPIWFEDDVALQRGRPPGAHLLTSTPGGLRVFNFHPVLVALDAADLHGYAGLKASLASRGVRLTDATREDFAPFVQRGGVGSFLRTLTTFLEERPHLRGGFLADEARAALA
jgi:hypothetical protein